MTASWISSAATRVVSVIGRATLIVGGGVLAPLSSSVAALEWQYTPAATAETAHDTNIYMQSLGERPVTSTELSAAADIAARNERVEFRVAPRLSAIRYSEMPELDRENAFTNLSVALFNQRQRLSFGSAYALESALTSEFEDTGFVRADVDRTQASWNADWSRVAGERGRYEVAALSSSVDYGQSGGSPFMDYRYELLQMSYNRTTNERSEWRFAVTRSDLAREALSATTSTTELRTTWSRAFSPVLRASFGVGYFDVDAELTPGSDNSGGAVDFSLSRSWAFWTLNAGGGRDVRPDGSGVLVREDSLTVSATRRMTARLNVEVSAREARTVSAAVNTLYHRDYARRGVSVQWRVAQRLWLHGSVYERSESRLQFAGLPDVASPTGIVSQLSITYRGR